MIVTLSSSSSLKPISQLFIALMFTVLSPLPVKHNNAPHQLDLNHFTESCLMIRWMNEKAVTVGLQMAACRAMCSCSSVHV